MKTKLLYIIVLFLVFTGTSCENKADNEVQSNVPYKPCACENEKIEIYSGLKKMEAVLFKDLTEKQIDEKIYQTKFSGTIIVYNSETDSACLYSIHKPMVGIANICNFPDFAKEWNIPENGHRVYIEGKEYKACNPLGGPATDSDMILTILKLK